MNLVASRSIACMMVASRRARAMQDFRLHGNSNRDAVSDWLVGNHVTYADFRIACVLPFANLAGLPLADLPRDVAATLIWPSSLAAPLQHVRALADLHAGRRGRGTARPRPNRPVPEPHRMT
jgi:glutathione S-transferase